MGAKEWEAGKKFRGVACKYDDDDDDEITLISMGVRLYVIVWQKYSIETACFHAFCKLFQLSFKIHVTN